MQCVIGMRPTKYFYINMSQDVVTSDSDDDNADDRSQILSVKIFSAHHQKTLFICTNRKFNFMVDKHKQSTGCPKKVPRFDLM